MTAVSTKVPVGRVGGTGSPLDGPMPMPRVVGNRRIRTGGIALATMLLAFGAALSGIALVSVAKTSAYIAIAKPVAVGSTITPDELTTVQLSGGGGLTLIPAANLNTVVGRHAAVSLIPGTLLSPGQLTDKPLVGSDQAQVGIAVAARNLPATTLAPGEAIVLVPLTAPSTSGPAVPHEYAATVVDVSAVGSDGSIVLHIAIAADLAPTIVALNAAGGIAIVLKPGN
jgi:SAF domain